MAKSPTDHLCNYFILPLIGLNRVSFGEGNFINSFVTKEGNVLVHLKGIPKQQDAFKHPLYLADFPSNGIYAVLFKMQDDFLPDVALYLQGKYSKMSERAKSLIKKLSTLHWRVPNADDKTAMLCDERLLALDRDPIYRKKLEAALGSIIDPEAELLSAPDEAELVSMAHNA